MFRPCPASWGSTIQRTFVRSFLSWDGAAAAPLLVLFPSTSHTLLHSSFPCLNFLFGTRNYMLTFTTHNSKEKWDASGGNEALGRVTASIPESTKTMVGSMFKKENLRGPTVFFGIGEERPYYFEKTPSLLAERLRHNMTFFYLNYFLIAAILFLLTLLVNPSTIIGIGLLAAAWFWLVRASQDGSLHISSKSVSMLVGQSHFGCWESISMLTTILAVVHFY